MIRQSSNEHSRDSESSEVGTSSSSISTQRHVSSNTPNDYSMQLDEVPITDCLSSGDPKDEENIEGSLQQITAAAPTPSFSKATFYPNTFSNSPPLVPTNSYRESAAMDVSSSTHQPPNSNSDQNAHSSVIESRLSESYSIDDSTAAVLGQQSSAHSAPSPPLNQSGTNSSAHNSHGNFISFFTTIFFFVICIFFTNRINKSYYQHEWH